jgi:redox-sensitive bicupin YhaK (pirin superfamily)
LQNINPRYQQRSFPRAKRVNKLQTIVWGEEGPEHCWINQNAKLSLGYFDSPQQLSYSFVPANKCLFIFVIEGTINVAGTALNEREAIGIWETGAVSIRAEAGAHFLIIETPVNQK